MGEEIIEADHRDDRLDPDFLGAEPADLLAAVEQQLQRADADREREEPEPVEAQMLVALGLLHEQHHADHGDDADRQVDQEHPVPGVIVGEPGAQRRAHDRAEHHADAPDRHRLAALLERIGVEQARLRQRHQRGARHALQQAEQHHLLDVLRQRAQERGDGEAGDADDEQLLAPEAVGHPADRRGHDGGGDDVGGEHPVDLVERGRQRALHIGQRHVGDRGVERLHDGRRHRAHRDQHAPRLRRHRRKMRRAHFAALRFRGGRHGTEAGYARCRCRRRRSCRSATDACPRPCRRRCAPARAAPP